MQNRVKQRFVWPDYPGEEPVSVSFSRARGLNWYGEVGDIDLMGSLDDSFSTWLKDHECVILMMWTKGLTTRPGLVLWMRSSLLR